LLTSLIVLIAISLVTASVVKLGTFDHRMNLREESNTYGRLATESVLENAAAQIEGRLMSSSTLTKDMLINSPLTALSVSTFPTSMGVESTELKAGIIPSGSIEWINPALSDNADDPLKGQNVLSRYLIMVGKSTIDGRDFYGKMRLQVRDSNLFNYNVFFMDTFSMCGGGTITYNGHIYSGADVYLGASNNGDLHTYDGTIMAAGDIWYSKPGKADGAYPGDIRIKDSSGNYQYMNGSAGQKGDDKFLDFDTLPNWASGSEWSVAANNTWGGTVMDQAHGIKRFTPPSIDDASESFHQIIEAPIALPSSNGLLGLGIGGGTASPDAYAAATANDAFPYDPSIESLKIGNQADLIIQVDVDYSDSYNPSNEPHNAGRASTEQANHNGWNNNRYNLADWKAEKAYDYNRANDNNTTTVRAFTMVKDSSGEYIRDGERYTRKEITSDFSALHNSFDSNGNPTSIVTTHESGGDPIKFYDFRRRQWIHSADIDMGNLKAALDNGEISNWNGGVYIESKVRGTSLDQRSNGRTDGDRVFDQFPGFDQNQSSEFSTYSRTGIRLKNGAIGNIPSSGADPGLMLATNNQLYIYDHFNADGNVDTGDDGTADTGELPVALLADTVSVMSGAWDDEKSRHSLSDRKGTDIEIAAAVIGGVMPDTDVSNISVSRSSDTMIRFMEEHRPNSGRTKYVHRGAVVNLWDSLVAPQAPVRGRYTDNTPNRFIVFADLFAQGNYPPLSPTFRTFQRIHYRDITEAEYTDTSTLIAQASTLTEAEFETKLAAIRAKYEN